jgi:hypothetical protein
VPFRGPRRRLGLLVGTSWRYGGVSFTALIEPWGRDANVAFAVTPLSKGDPFADEPWLSIRWDPGGKFVYAEWTSFANSSQFRASTMRILDAIKARNAQSLISDNRRLEGVADQDQLWIRDSWVPEAVAAGIKRIAVVVPTHGLGKIATNEIISRLGNTVFATRTFTTVSEATEWVSEA